MLELLYLEVDILGIVILMMLLFNLIKNQRRKMLLDQNLFALLLITNLFLLICDAVMYLLNHRQFAYAREWNIVITTIYFILSPLICFFWLLYNDYKINQNKKRLLKYMPIYVIPTIISTFLTLLSPITGWIYAIDKYNDYHKGSLFIGIPLLAFTYLFYAAYLTIKKGKESDDLTKKELYHYMLILPIVPFIGSVVQSFICGVSITWILVTLTLLNMYINIQNHQIYTDQLTGLYNRKFIENYLLNNMQKPKDGILFALFIDVDKFKGINDTFGHLVGDKALIQIATILKRACSVKKDYLARMGGDEFLIVGRRASRDEVEAITRQIQERVDIFNESGQAEYILSLSMGYTVFGENNIHTMDAFINGADKQMYCHKRSK